MKKRQIVIIVAIILLVLSFLPLFLDPYYHKERVCFWTWVLREIDELQHGERE
jgi:hypothetical protein